MHIADSYPTEIFDRLMASMGSLGDPTLRFEMTFSHKLDDARLSKAFDLLFLETPILGCKLSISEKETRWLKLPNESIDKLFVTFSHEDYNSFKYAFMDAQKGPLIKGCLLHSQDKDWLIFKFNHEICDAGGLVQTINSLSYIYTKLKYNPNYMPTLDANLSRSEKIVMDQVKWYSKFRILKRFLRVNKLNASPLSSPSFFFMDKPLATTEKNTTITIERYIGPEKLEKIKKFGKQNNASINDMFLTAFFIALKKMDENESSQVRISMGIDLRRFIPEGQKPGVCNLSWMEILSLPTDSIPENFSEALRKICAITGARKDFKWFGINSLVAFLPIARKKNFYELQKQYQEILNAEINKKTISLQTSNITIDPKLLMFDGSPDKAYVINPAIKSPLFGCLFNRYNNAIYMNATVYGPAKDKTDRLFDMVLHELNQVV